MVSPTSRESNFFSCGHDGREGLAIAHGVIERVVGVLGLLELLPVLAGVKVVLQARVKVPDAACGMPKRIAVGVRPKVVIHELPVERGVVRDKHRTAAALVGGKHPLHEVGHHDGGAWVGQVLLAADTGYGQGAGDPLF